MKNKNQTNCEANCVSICYVKQMKNVKLYFHNLKLNCSDNQKVNGFTSFINRAVATKMCPSQIACFVRELLCGMSNTTNAEMKQNCNA